MGEDQVKLEARLCAIAVGGKCQLTRDLRQSFWLTMAQWSTPAEIIPLPGMCISSLKEKSPLRMRSRCKGATPRAGRSAILAPGRRTRLSKLISGYILRRFPRTSLWT
jgi:hypothetical protein